MIIIPSADGLVAAKLSLFAPSRLVFKQSRDSGERGTLRYGNWKRGPTWTSKLVERYQTSMGSPRHAPSPVPLFDLPGRKCANTCCPAVHRGESGEVLQHIHTPLARSLFNKPLKVASLNQFCHVAESIILILTWVLLGIMLVLRFSCRHRRGIPHKAHHVRSKCKLGCACCKAKLHLQHI